MSTAAESAISLAEEALRLSLADSPAFRTWCGAANQAEALAKIHHEALPAPANADAYTKSEIQGLRPYAIVWTDPEDGHRRERIAQGVHKDGGTLHLRLVQNYAAGDAPGEASRKLENDAGKILDDLETNSTTSGVTSAYLVIERMAPAGPYRCGDDEEVVEGDFLWMDVRVEWGG
ncbi:MAG: hypothetical protein AABZ12_10500 [Planctomycetota bacterium]